MELCRCSSPRKCKKWVKYHHFYETPEGRDRRFLREYFKYDPSALLFSAHFFKAGVELGLANRYHRQVQRRLEYLGTNAGYGSEEEKAVLYSQLSYFSRVSNCALEVLGQSARFWDSQAARGLFPPRPGRESIPELDVTILEDSHFRVANWVKNDNGPVPWPDNVETWPNFSDLLPFREDPSIVSWCFPQGIGAISNFGGYSFPSTPSRTSDWVLSQENASLSFGLVDPLLAQQVPDVGQGNNTRQFPPPASADVDMDIDMDVDMGLPGQQQQQQQGSSESAVDVDGDGDSNGSPIPVRRYPARISKRIRETKKADREAISPTRTDSPTTSSSSRSDSSGSLGDNDRDGSSSGEDKDKDQNENESGEDDDAEEDEEDKLGPNEYPVEALVNHKPKRAARSDVKHYKVRWEGDWPARQKETWEHRSNIAPMIIREYWLNFDKRRELREQVGKVRRAR
ncbi:hypothetical protein F5X99DRAFT_414247 [Biscogniauxia marginata]|nr:hypothetical protein F5X99DRAFT_414247 [Biscogniauxia marginata]